MVIARSWGDREWFQFHKMKRGRQWLWLHTIMNVFNTIELCTYKWLGE
jgi:hypothetical protein